MSTGYIVKHQERGWPGPVFVLRDPVRMRSSQLNEHIVQSLGLQDCDVVEFQYDSRWRPFDIRRSNDQRWEGRLVPLRRYPQNELHYQIQSDIHGVFRLSSGGRMEMNSSYTRNWERVLFYEVRGRACIVNTPWD